jgi:hypothetical protein
VSDVRERMGLRVKEVTLRSDWDKNSILADVRGAVWIDVTPACILSADLVLEIAQYLAEDAAHETLEDNITVDVWKVERNGDRLEVTAQQFTDTDYAPPTSQPIGFRSSPLGMHGFGR